MSGRKGDETDFQKCMEKAVQSNCTVCYANKIRRLNANAILYLFENYTLCRESK